MPVGIAIALTKKGVATIPIAGTIAPCSNNALELFGMATQDLNMQRHAKRPRRKASELRNNQNYLYKRVVSLQAIVGMPLLEHCPL